MTDRPVWIPESTWPLAILDHLRQEHHAINERLNRLEDNAASADSVAQLALRVEALEKGKEESE